MTFPLEEQFINCSAMIEPASRERAAARIGELAAEQVERHGFVIFKIGALRLDEDTSRQIAHRLAAALHTALIAAGAPQEMYVEIDRSQRTAVPEPFQVRSLLPHSDGQHSSYLTPSILDVPNWDPAMRIFSDRGYTTTHVHKMYQGIFIADPGEGLSATTYYDWLRILDDVRSMRQETRPAGTPEWLGWNLRRCIEGASVLGVTYPTLAGMLGLTEECLVATPLLHCEDPLPAAAVEEFPLLRSLKSSCACGGCVGDIRRVFCHVVMLATGMPWPAFRGRYEILAPSERFDMLFGNNLTMLHGGLAGGRNRLIEPICLAVNKPAGAAYERWLSRAWRRFGQAELAGAAAGERA
jgi:hypothetical protein